YEALKKEFKFVIDIPWGVNKNLSIDKNDLYITTLSDEVSTRNALRFDKFILIDPNNFDSNKWKYGVYKKYGYSIKTILGIKYEEYLKKCLFEMAQTNDVAIRKWSENHPDVYDTKK